MPIFTKYGHLNDNGLKQGISVLYVSLGKRGVIGGAPGEPDRTLDTTQAARPIGAI